MSYIDKLEFLSQLLFVGNRIPVWQLDKNGKILSTTAEDSDVLNKLFAYQNNRQRVSELFSNIQNPCILGSRLGPVFGIIPNKSNPDDELRYVVLGPVCYESISRTAIAKAVAEESISFQDYSSKDIVNALIRIPRSSITIIEKEMTKINYVLNGEEQKPQITFSLARPSTGILPSDSEEQFQEVYLYEQKLMNIVRSGDLSYVLYDKANLEHKTAMQSYQLSNLLHAKVSLLSFLVLVSRAAIEGGLSTVESFTIMDKYIISIDSAQRSELVDIAVSLFDEYVSKVHAAKNTKNYSFLVQKCISYIEQHINQKILASDLAECLGYNDYYLTKKFHEETGFYINEYVQNYKIEKAKQILETSDMKIQEISGMLGFSTCNYFCTCFRNVTGQSPQNYRISMAKL